MSTFHCFICADEVYNGQLHTRNSRILYMERDNANDYRNEEISCCTECAQAVTKVEAKLKQVEKLAEETFHDIRRIRLIMREKEDFVPTQMQGQGENSSGNVRDKIIQGLNKASLELLLNKIINKNKEETKKKKEKNQGQKRKNNSSQPLATSPAGLSHPVAATVAVRTQAQAQSDQQNSNPKKKEVKAGDTNMKYKPREGNAATSSSGQNLQEVEVIDISDDDDEVLDFKPKPVTPQAVTASDNCIRDGKALILLNVTPTPGSCTTERDSGNMKEIAQNTEKVDTVPTPFNLQPSAPTDFPGYQTSGQLVYLGEKELRILCRLLPAIEYVLNPQGKDKNDISISSHVEHASMESIQEPSTSKIQNSGTSGSGRKRCGEELPSPTTKPKKPDMK